MIFFKRKYDSITSTFYDNKILTVHELYIYDLLEFCLRSAHNRYPNPYLNSLFTLKNFAYNTRKSSSITFCPPFCKNRTNIQSLTYRGSRLLNILGENSLLPKNFGLMERNDEILFVHKFRDNYILGNYELLQNVFK